MSKPKQDDFEAVRTIVAALESFDAMDQERILRWTREKLGLTQHPPELPVKATPPVVPPPGIPALQPAQGSDIKSFVEKKKPSSDTQFAAAIAYYYRFEAPSLLRKDSITSADLLEACRQTGRKRIRHLRQTLVNTHRQGLLDRAERGAYSINTVGENLVAMALPSDEQASSTIRAKPPRERKKTTKSATKKSKRITR